MGEKKRDGNIVYKDGVEFKPKSIPLCDDDKYIWNLKKVEWKCEDDIELGKKITEKIRK